MVESVLYPGAWVLLWSLLSPDASHRKAHPMKLHHLLILSALLSSGCPGGSAPQSRFEAAAGKAIAAGKEKPGPENEVTRKIIYTAKVDLLVEAFDQAQKDLLQLIAEHKGYVAGSEVGGSPGTPRSGTWTVRIPETNFQTFRTAVQGLGYPQRSTIASQDVTEEFYDLQARIKNMKVEEEGLSQLLIKQSTGKLEDILAARRELSRVRGEIDQAQGRLQKLSKLTELATVTITLQERKGYMPGAAPSFGTTIGRTFEGSLDVLLGFGKGIVLFLVALVPWLPILAMPVVLIWLLIRRARSRPVPNMATVLPVEPPRPPAHA